MLMFCDSFDHYQTNQLPEKYQQTADATIASPGRFGTGNCLSMAPTSGGYVQYSMPDQSQLIAGFAFNPSGFPGPGQKLAFLMFSEPAGTQGSLQINNAGGIEYHVTLNNIDTIIAASPNGIIKTGTFQYIEANVLFSPTQGSVSAQVNGQSVFSVTGVNTAPTGNDYAASVLLIMGNIDYYGTFEFDDFYICNGSGEYNNSFLGDIAVEALFPDGPGQSTQFTLSPDNPYSYNWECVAQYPPVSANYVYDSTQHQFDLYKIPELPSSTQQVVAVQIVASAEKDDSNTRVLGLGFGNGTTYVFDAGDALTSSYWMYTQPYDINPITNAPWAVSDFSTAQIGIMVVE